MELTTVKIDKPDEINFILGQTHFIKSVEDIHEAMVQMRTGRPRPTEIEIPWDTLRSSGEVEFLPAGKISPARNNRIF